MKRKTKWMGLLLSFCMVLSLTPTVALAANSDVDDTAETEFYRGDGTVYEPADHVTKEECWDLNTRIPDSNATYWTAGDKLTWTSEAKMTKGGKHNSSWCGSFQNECGHYGEDTYRIEQYLGFTLDGDEATLDNLDAPKQVYVVPAVDEEAMETYGDSKTRPANTMTTKDYDVVNSVTVKSYPTRIIYNQYGTNNSTSKRCGVKNGANEYISFETYTYYVEGKLEVDSLSIDAVPVQYNLQGGIMKEGETLPSAYLITEKGYECEVSSPVRLGYTFKGWRNEYSGRYVYADSEKIGTSSIYGSLWDFLKGLKPGDIDNIISAQWEEADVSLSLDPSGGTINGSSAVTNLNSISYSSQTSKDTSYLDIIPEKNGSVFLGWYLGDTKITCIDDIPQSEWNSDNSYTLTAEWNNEDQKPQKEITTVDFGNVWKYLDSTQPVAFTTELNPNSDCPKQMDIAEQRWTNCADSSDTFSTNDSGNWLPTTGEKYCFSIKLTAKDGYCFAKAQGLDLRFSGTVICDGTTIVNNGALSVFDGKVVSAETSYDLKTLVVTGYPMATALEGSQDNYVIDNVVINNAPTSCVVGEAPSAMAIKSGENASNYTFYEYWEEMVQTGNGIEPVKFWYSDPEQMSRVTGDAKLNRFEEGRLYYYSIVAKPNTNYSFASKDTLSVMLNGENISNTKSVLVSEAGNSLIIEPGTFMTPAKPVVQKEVKLIEINNATVSFHVGDKPAFTGTAASGAPYVIDYEGWFGADNKFICNSDYWNKAYVEQGRCDGLISSFKTDTTYTYQLYVKLTDKAAAEGYVFSPNTKLQVNGKIVECVQYPNKGDLSWMAGTKLTMTPAAAAHTHTYKKTITKATTSKNGSIVTKCSVCGAVKSKSIIYYPKTIKLSTTNYTYGGNVKKPGVKVVGSNGKTISARNYTVSYARGRKNVGKYTVKITFKGNYSGKKNLYFTIKPKATSISNLTASKKAFTVKWKKQSSQTTGYQLQYATNSKFSKAKTVTISRNSTTSKKISKLSARKKYYVRVRTYKTVNGVKYYSAWSKAESVTTKK